MLFLTNMPIQKAGINDVDVLTALVNSAYRGEFAQKGWTTEANILDGIRIDKQMMTSYLEDPDATVLKYLDDDGRIIACVYLQVRKSNRLYLGMLTVSPLMQAGGIGRQLLEEAEVWAKILRCDTIFMTVITTRAELISWYERRGYKATGKKVPFPQDIRFGIPKQEIELEVYEKEVK